MDTTLRFAIKDLHTGKLVEPKEGRLVFKRRCDAANSFLYSPLGGYYCSYNGGQSRYQIVQVEIKEREDE